MPRACCGATPPAGGKAGRLQAAVDSFVGAGVIVNKFSEAGKNSYTDAGLEAVSLLHAAALRYHQPENLTGLTGQWQKDDDIEIHPEILKY